MMVKKIKNNTKAVLAVFGLVCVFSAPVQADLNNGLLAYYSFDDCTAKDSSPNALDGSFPNTTPTCVDGVTLNGVTNKALKFISGDYISTVLPTVAPVTNYTISMWVKTNRTATGDLFDLVTAVGGNVDSSVTLNSGKFCNYFSYSGVNYCSDKAMTNGFNHLVLVVTGREVRHYTNGILVSRSTASPLAAYSVNQFAIGYAQRYGWLDGVLDEFRYYNRVLSTPEITALYNQSQDVSAKVQGIQQTGLAVECQNITTGQTVSIASVVFDCEAAGLVASPNDIIHINIDGKAN